MANTRISDLTASASNLASTDLAPVVQTVGVGPVKMTGLQLAGGLLGSTTFNGSTVTTSSPVLNLTQTWNDNAGGTVTFTGLKFNATDTASASGSLLLDLQVGGTSVARITKQGGVYSSDGQLSTGNGFRFVGSANGFYSPSVSSSNFYAAIASNAVLEFRASGLGMSRNSISWGSIGGTQDVIIYGPTAATLQLGAADAAAPVAQTFKVQSVVGSTPGATDVAGANFTIQGSAGRGSGAGGSIIFQVAPAGSAGTGAQNAYVTALSILNPASNNVMLRLLSNNAYIKSTDANTFAIGDFNSGSSGINYGILVRPLSNDTGLKTSIGITIAGGAFGSNETLIYSDAANTLALKNSTNPQIFRAYSTTTGPSYGYLAAGVTDAGVATADTLFIGTGGAGAAMTKLALVVNGTTRLDYGVTTSGSWTSSNSSDAVFRLVTSDAAGKSRYIASNSSGKDAIFNMYSTGFGVAHLAGNGGFGSDTGIVIFADAGVTSGGSNSVILSAGGYNNKTVYILPNQLVSLGGTTSSFPALKRISSGNCLQVIAADNTASAGFIVGNQALATTATDGFLYVPTCAGTPTGTPTTQTGTAPIVVDTTNNKLYFYSGGQWRDAGP